MKTDHPPIIVCELCARWALTTGMKPSEYLALNWSDIDWQRGIVCVCRTIQVTGTTWICDDTKRKRSQRIVKASEPRPESTSGLRERQEGEREGNCSSAVELIFISAASLLLKQRMVK